MPWPVLQEEAEIEWFYEDLQDLLEPTPQKDVLFIIGDWIKRGKSRNTWSNRQVWPWSTKWSRSKANRVLPGECTGHSKHTVPTRQDKTRLYTWTSPDGQYWNQIDYILCSQGGEALYSQQKHDWELTGSDHELLIAKFRLKLKKVGKTTTPFRYDLNQIPYDYTVEVTNRFKGLDLIDRVPEELCTEVCDIV